MKLDPVKATRSEFLVSEISKELDLLMPKRPLNIHRFAAVQHKLHSTVTFF